MKKSYGYNRFLVRLMYLTFILLPKKQLKMKMWVVTEGKNGNKKDMVGHINV